MTDVLVLYGAEDKKFFRVRPLTDEGKQWLQTNSPAENWCNGTLIVPERIIERLTLAMHAAGLILGGES